VSAWKEFRTHFLTGLVAISPLAITVWILVQAYRLVSRTVRPWLTAIPGLTEAFPYFVLTLIAFCCLLVAIAAVGVFARNLAGRAFFGLVERAFDRIPLVKSVFASTKQIAEVLMPGQQAAFKQVVLFRYPQEGSFSLGFLTHPPAPSGFAAVFLPTVPNPTTGFLLMLPADEVELLPLSVEEGIRLIISGGAVMTPAQAALVRTHAARLTDRGQVDAGAP
jgi:uncharacterized membrane protein